MVSKNRVKALAAAGMIILVVGYFASAQARPAAGETRPVGEIVKVEQGGSATASPGDLVQFQVTYPVIPGSFLENIDVDITGTAARLATVASTRVTTPDGRPTYGAGALSAFLIAESEGVVVIKIKPVKQGGAKGKELEYRLTIKKREAQ